MTPELKEWIEELKQYRGIGRALDGKEPLPDEDQPPIDKQGLLILGCLAAGVIIFAIMLCL